ncbi:hypothetical protein CBR_g22489 [Chara braunii]|uniref:Mediator of RNA polymerase II transcription subunit 6 n=1 Tax=Chara braunii TaxID=69332 RepID=A0A388L2R8_CHABU|nr:hypothetical protein CBR_g22489 [Chara braunii]|eukprot:GBG76610.1 hypothetical protein CBR_g22489 [Chara braunii]
MGAPPPPMGLGPGAPGDPVPTDQTGVCFRDQIWLSTFPLIRASVLDYFALSPFYDGNCNNQLLRNSGKDPALLSTMTTGFEYVVRDAIEPHLFIIRKQVRGRNPEVVTPIAAYYVLDGSIYQAPSLHAVIGSRLARALHHIRGAFTEVATKLDRTLSDLEAKEGDSKGEGDEKKADDSKDSSAKRLLDIREVLRNDQIIASVFQKLPQAPPPPPLPAFLVRPPPQAPVEGSQDQTTEKQQGPSAASGSGAPAMSGGGKDAGGANKQRNKGGEGAVSAPPDQGPAKRARTSVA